MPIGREEEHNILRSPTLLYIIYKGQKMTAKKFEKIVKKDLQLHTCCGMILGHAYVHGMR